MRVFFFDLWSHRGFRYTFITVLSIVACLTCFHLVLNWSGEKRWQRIKAKLEADGETFDFYALYPPPIPDDQNFCAIECLNGIRTPEGTNPEADKKRSIISDQLRFLSPEFNAVFAMDAFVKGRDFDEMEALAQLSKNTVLNAKHPIHTWQDSRMAIERQSPLLLALAEAAKSRPQADYLPRSRLEDLPELLVKLPIPQLNTGQDIGNACRVHSCVCIQAGDAKAAIAQALVLLRLGTSANYSRSLIGNLVGLTHYGQFYSQLWFILSRRTQDNLELELIQKELQSLDHAAELLACTRSEVAMYCNTADYLASHPQERWGLIESGGSAAPGRIGMFLCSMIPSGYFLHSNAAIVQLENDWLVKPLKTQRLQKMHANLAALEPVVESISIWSKPDLLIARSSLPTFSIIFQMGSLAENQRLQAILACALERHLLRHGSYPATLEALDPEFLAGNDLLDVNGEKMHYALIPGGRFRLWSPGPDGRDDGGKFGVEISASMKKAPYHSTYLGDWAWRYDPAEKAP